MKLISTTKAPEPAGHYSQAVCHGDLIFVSGQLAIDSSGKKYNDQPIEKQTEVVLTNISNILEESGSGLHGLLSVTIYITDIEHWPGVNKVYGKFLGSHKPARAVVPVKDLHYGFLIEAQAVAIKLP